MLISPKSVYPAWEVGGLREGRNLTNKFHLGAPVSMSPNLAAIGIHIWMGFGVRRKHRGSWGANEVPAPKWQKKQKHKQPASQRESAIEWARAPSTQHHERRASACVIARRVCPVGRQGNETLLQKHLRKFLASYFIAIARQRNAEEGKYAGD